MAIVVFVFSVVSCYFITIATATVPFLVVVAVISIVFIVVFVVIVVVVVIGLWLLCRNFRLVCSNFAAYNLLMNPP